MCVWCVCVTKAKFKAYFKACVFGVVVCVCACV